MMVARKRKKRHGSKFSYKNFHYFLPHSTKTTRWATREHPLHFCWWKFQLFSLLRVERDFEISVFNAFNLKSWFKLHLKWAAFLLLIRGKSVFQKSAALESWNWVFWSMSVAVFSFFSDEISNGFGMWKTIIISSGLVATKTDLIGLSKLYLIQVFVAIIIYISAYHESIWYLT